MGLKMDEEKEISVLSIGLVLVVLIIKLISTLFVQSMSFTAEFSDALLDLIQVAITFFALRLSRRPPDFDHMYGHGKINSLAGFIESLLIIGLYGSIGFFSIKRIVKEPNYQTENNLIGIASLLLTITIVFFVSRRIVLIGKETQNKTIIAQGLNFRSDFYRNIAVILGLVITYLFDLGWVDLILALIVSFFTIIEGIKVLKSSINELLDANAFAEDLIQDVKNHIEQIPTVLHVDNLAIRTISKQMEVLIIISIPPKIGPTRYKSLNHEIKEIFLTHFPTMDLNMNIQINIRQREKESIKLKESIVSIESLESQKIFKIIRNIRVSDFKISDLHNIYLDNYPEKMILQYHNRVHPEFTLKDAHTQANLLESKIEEILKNKNPKKLIEVISHIETEHQSLVHNERTKNNLDINDLINLISTLPKTHNNVFKIDKVEINENPSGNSVILLLLFPSLMKFYEVEKIMDKIEEVLYNCPYHVHRVLIHPEPLDL